MSEADLTVHLESLRPFIDAYNAVDRMAQALPGEISAHVRPPPAADDNPCNAWYGRPSKGAAGGKLNGKRVALKDNTCLAGVPMMNGARARGVRPRFRRHHRHAHSRRRRHDRRQGGLRKLCFSGGSHTSPLGAGANPQKHGPLGGGSSSGAPPGGARRSAIWRSAATRAARSGFRLRFAASTGMKPPTAWCPTPASCRSSRRSTTPGRLTARRATRRCCWR